MSTHVQSRVKLADVLKALLDDGRVDAAVPLAMMPAGAAWVRVFHEGDELVTEWIEPSEVYVEFGVEVTR